MIPLLFREIEGISWNEQGNFFFASPYGPILVTHTGKL
jgi:hypothetical protein